MTYQQKFYPNQTSNSSALAPPPLGFFKLNTDGSSLTNPGVAGAGGLTRNHLGEWISGFYRNLGMATNTIAELWALRDGLLLVKSLNIDNLQVELDAKAIAELIS